MVKLGVSQEQSKAIAATAPTQQTPAARIATVNNAPVVQLAENFDRAWRRVGLAWTAPASRWKTATATTVCTSCAMWRLTPTRRARLLWQTLWRLVCCRSTAEVPHRRAQRGQCLHRVRAQRSWRPESSANAERIVRVIADELK